MSSYRTPPVAASEFHKSFKHKRGYDREHPLKKVTKEINVIYSSFGEALFII